MNLQKSAPPPTPHSLLGRIYAQKASPFPPHKHPVVRLRASCACSARDRPQGIFKGEPLKRVFCVLFTRVKSTVPEGKKEEMKNRQVKSVTPKACCEAVSRYEKENLSNPHPINSASATPPKTAPPHEIIFKIPPNKHRSPTAQPFGSDICPKGVNTSTA